MVVPTSPFVHQVPSELWSLNKLNLMILFFIQRAISYFHSSYFLTYFDALITLHRVFAQVIDEIYRVLRYVNSTRAPQRAHEVLQELRDISSMAMEYFDEKIVPILKKKLPGADLSGRLISSAPGKVHWCRVDPTPAHSERGH